MEIFFWEYTSIFSLFKIKIRLLKSDKKWLRYGSSTKPLLSRCRGDNTTKKTIVLKKINLLWNSGHLDQQNDIKLNMFRCLIPLI